ncbi:MAG: hypothetical protein OHK0031_01750 [Anaerolineales bacterium]
MTLPFALVIEDDPILGKVYLTALKSVGFEAALDPDGDLYAEVLKTRLPDIIFLDLHLPYASGAEILAAIRANEAWRAIPVVVMTADIITAKQMEGRADQVLIKPVSVMRIQEIAAQLTAPK